MTARDWLNSLSVGSEVGTRKMMRGDAPMLTIVRSTPKWLFTSDGKKWRRETGEILEAKREYYGADHPDHLMSPEDVQEERRRLLQQEVGRRIKDGPKVKHSTLVMIKDWLEADRAEGSEGGQG